MRAFHASQSGMPLNQAHSKQEGWSGRQQISLSFRFSTACTTGEMEPSYNGIHRDHLSSLQAPGFSIRRPAVSRAQAGLQVCMHWHFCQARVQDHWSPGKVSHLLTHVNTTHRRLHCHLLFDFPQTGTTAIHHIGAPWRSAPHRGSSIPSSSLKALVTL